jgi:hypothetical protein
VADYFPEVAEKAGEALGVDKARCFSGLPGFRKLESDLTGLKA